MENAILQKQSTHSTFDSQAPQSEGRRSQSPPPFQLKASSGAPIQRYPIDKKSSTQIESISGRPNAKSNKGTIQDIIGRIWSFGPCNDLETKLKGYGSKSKAVDAICNDNFLSLNGAAICHKEAISVIEEQLVSYGNMCLNGTNSSSIDSSAQEWIKSLTALDSSKQSTCLSYLSNVTNAVSNAGVFGDAASDMATYLTYLLLELDGSHTNLYVGYQRTNSSISDNFDPHYNVYETSDPSATPMSTSIYESHSSFGSAMGTGHSSPRREVVGTDHWNETSCLPDKGYIVYDHTKNQYL